MCEFIYNFDNKNILLDKTKYYLNLDESDKPWNDYGIKVKYIFY